MRRPLADARREALAAVTARTAAGTAKPLAGALAVSVRPAAEKVLAQLAHDSGRAFPVKLPDYDLTGRLERVDRIVGEFGADTVAELDATLAEGANLGEAIFKLAGRVAAVFDAADSRATLIARTEVVGASNGIAHAQANEAAALGLALWKTWLATADDRTREDHAFADGQTVPNDQPFEVGDDLLMYPGDPDGSAEQVCNCRCTVTYDDQPPDGADAGDAPTVEEESAA